MLQISAIEPTTLGILKQLMQIPELKIFNLAGGTALALRYGHRRSVDLDLFSSKNFTNETVVKAVSRSFATFTYRSLNNPIRVFGFIDEVKIDFVKYKYHQHPLIAANIEMDDIRIISDEDIIAMKINVILRRAVKKNFRDLSELLNHYSLSSCIDFYHHKYKDQMLVISIPQAITYFEDAEESEAPISLKNQTWEKVKNNIQQKVREYLA